METIKNLFGKPDPQAQFRKCNAIIRSNIRKLDRDIAALKAVETKAKNLILASDRRGARNPSQQKQAAKDVRTYARELIRTRKASARLVTGKAQLSSVQMQVNEAFALRKIEGSIRASVGIMKDVNQLVHLPQLAVTMEELSRELMKAGIIEEMVGDMLPEDGDELMEGEDEEAEGEVDKVLGEILKDKMDKAPVLPNVPSQGQKVPVQQQGQQQRVEAEEEEEDEEDTEAMMDQMRNRLEALRS
ncbi:Snf7-domain-containing protein [Bombardia bombarda]|uniref:Snf7-domain-containing protein n=1 Tax=Bombardia bombarda TaxID=252184 RepID=A0AA39WI84_9PEZI|nr:Snf7-domain-containing protein [Bombardia bombarda]